MKHLLMYSQFFETAYKPGLHMYIWKKEDEWRGSKPLSFESTYTAVGS